jgi:hypothetical protein
VLLTLFTEGYTSYIRVICKVKENKTMGHLTYVLLGVDKLIAFLRKNIPLFSCTTITSVCFLCVFVITMSWCRYAFNFDNGLKNLCVGSLCGLGGDPCHCFNRLCCPIPGMDNPTTRPMCCIVMYTLTFLLTHQCTQSNSWALQNPMPTHQCLMHLTSR